MAAKKARQQERKKSLPGQRTPLPRAVPKENLILTPGTYCVTVALADIHTASLSPVTVTDRADKLFDQIDQNGFIGVASGSEWDQATIHENRYADQRQPGATSTHHHTSSELAAVRLAEAAERAKARFMKEDAEAAGLSLADIDQPLSPPVARPHVQQRTDPAAAVAPAGPHTRIDSNEVSHTVSHMSHYVSYFASPLCLSMPLCSCLSMPLHVASDASSLCLTISHMSHMSHYVSHLASPLCLSARASRCLTLCPSRSHSHR